MVNFINHPVTGTANPLTTQATSGSSGSTGSSTNSPSSITGKTAQATEQQFLQLLVAQLKNQDPLSPMDGTQFVSQLAQFSELEQMIGVNQGVQQLVADAKGSSTPANNSSQQNSSNKS